LTNRLQGCQMVYMYFQTKQRNLGKFWRLWKMLVYLWTFMNVYDHLVKFMHILW
jgi:hypothetical protein